MSAEEVINVVKIIEVIQKSIFILLFVIIGLGIISLITNIVRIAIIRIVLSMILVVSAMITNLLSKFLTLDLMIYHINTKTFHKYKKVAFKRLFYISSLSHF